MALCEWRAASKGAGAARGTLDDAPTGVVAGKGAAGSGQRAAIRTPWRSACNAGTGLARAAVGWDGATGATPAASALRAAIAGGVTGAQAQPSAARAGVRVAGVWESKWEREKARKRRAWRDPWRAVVGRTGRDQARSVRVGVQCLAVGVSTKPRGRALANRGARNCDRRAASKWTLGLRAAMPRLPA